MAVSRLALQVLPSNLWEITLGLSWARDLSRTTSQTWNEKEPWDEVETRGRSFLRLRQTLLIPEITRSQESNSINGVLEPGTKKVALRLASGSLTTNWILRNEFITLTMPRTQNTNSIIKWANLKALSLIKMWVMVRPPTRMSVFRHRLKVNSTRSLRPSRTTLENNSKLKTSPLKEKAEKPVGFLPQHSMKGLWNWCRLVNRI